jgi:hypothetical protein
MTDDEPTIEQLRSWLRAGNDDGYDESPIPADRMHQLADRIIATESTPHRPASSTHHRRRVLAIVAGPVAIAALAAAGWALTRTDAREALSLACTTDGVTAVIPADGTPPIDACAQLWSVGAMDPRTSIPPPLVACVDHSGTVTVIEGASEAECDDRGLAAWTDQPAYEAAGRAITAVRVELHERFDETGNGCATASDWQTRLGRHPTTSAWTVTVDATGPDGPCLDIAAADPTTRTITLRPVRGAYSIGCDPRTGC